MIMFPISSLVVLSDKNSEREGEAMVLSDIIMVRGLDEADNLLYTINQYTSQHSLCWCNKNVSHFYPFPVYN